MKIQQIRNAALRISFGGKTFLTDPWLAPKGAMGPFNDPSFRYINEEQSKLAMPLCDLPMPLDKVLQDVDAYIVTHVHPDHIDMAADSTVGAPLNKETPVFVQSAEDEAVLRRSGFKNVAILDKDTVFGNIHLKKTPGLHGTKIPCGPSCGVILTAPNEDKKLYIAGDTIWFKGVEDTLSAERPDVIVLNACAAEFIDQGRLIMDDNDVECVVNAAPQATVIVSHMDNVAHASITRISMKERLTRRGIWAKVRMPDDGETLIL